MSAKEGQPENVTTQAPPPPPFPLPVDLFQMLGKHCLVHTRSISETKKHTEIYERVPCYFCQFAGIRRGSKGQHMRTTTLACWACKKGFHTECYFLYHNGPQEFEPEGQVRYDAVKEFESGSSAEGKTRKYQEQWGKYMRPTKEYKFNEN